MLAAPGLKLSTVGRTSTLISACQCPRHAQSSRARAWQYESLEAVGRPHLVSSAKPLTNLVIAARQLVTPEILSTGSSFSLREKQPWRIILGHCSAEADECVQLFTPGTPLIFRTPGP